MARWRTVLLALVLSAAAHAQPGLTVRDGQLWRNGAPYRGVGVNACDLFQALIADGDDSRTLEGLRYLGERGIPFVRFWACGFWPSDWDLYFADKDEWFRRLDRVVAVAEEAGVGLIPSLFWRTATYPDLFDEYQDQWGNPDSRTRRFMEQYVDEVVARYVDSPAIWGWEFANEMNLSCDLPNGMEFLGRSIPHLKVDLPRHERNLMTYDIATAAFTAFGEAVRRHDAHRFITPGNSAPRPSSWHNRNEASWTADSREQMAEVYGWLNPEPMDLASIHFYPKADAEPSFAGSEGIEAVLATHKALAAERGLPLFVGEFAASASEKDGLTLEQFRDHQARILEAMRAAGVDLAAYWVFNYTPDRTTPGIVRRDNDYAWVIDQLVAAHARWQ